MSGRSLALSPRLSPVPAPAPPPAGSSGPATIGLPSEEMENRKWRCCCGCVHVRTGAIIIAIFEILILCQLMIFSFTNYDAGRLPSAPPPSFTGSM